MPNRRRSTPRTRSSGSSIGWREFRGEAALSTWITSIALSVVYNGLRKIKRFRERETDLDDATSIAAGSRQAEPDLKVKLKAAIESLPDGYRTVFVMHDVEGYTHEEIAAALGRAGRDLQGTAVACPRQAADHAGGLRRRMEMTEQDGKTEGRNDGRWKTFPKGFVPSRRKSTHPPAAPREEIWARIQAARAVDRRTDGPTDPQVIPMPPDGSTVRLVRRRPHLGCRNRRDPAHRHRPRPDQRHQQHRDRPRRHLRAPRQHVAAREEERWRTPWPRSST